MAFLLKIFIIANIGGPQGGHISRRSVKPTAKVGVKYQNRVSILGAMSEELVPLGTKIGSKFNWYRMAKTAKLTLLSIDTNNTIDR